MTDRQPTRRTDRLTFGLQVLAFVTSTGAGWVLIENGDHYLSAFMLMLGCFALFMPGIEIKEEDADAH